MEKSFKTGVYRLSMYARRLPMRAAGLMKVSLTLFCLLFAANAALATGSVSQSMGYAGNNMGAGEPSGDNLVVNPRTPVKPEDLQGGSSDVKDTPGDAQDSKVMAKYLEVDTDGYYLIKSRTDWDNFAKYYDGTGNFRLAADITEGVTTMVSSSDVPFVGTFDGAGHTLTINYDFYENKGRKDMKNIAPFRYISGAHFKNLNITGIITTAEVGNHSAGFASEAIGGANTFDSCVSYVNLIVNATNSDATTAGFLGYQKNNGTISFNNCAFFGSLITDRFAKGWAGYVGYGDGTKVTIKNSVYAPNSNTKTSPHTLKRYGNAPFMRCDPNKGAATIENCFYHRTFGDSLQVEQQGTEITESEFANGEAHGVVRNTYESGSKAVETYDYYVDFDETKNNKPNMSLHANATRKVKLTRTFAEGWNTLVLPFSLSTDEVNAAFGEETEVAYFTNSAENTVELNLGEAGKKDITANQPVLIKPSKKGFVNFTFANKTIQNVANPTLKGENGISFVGSYDASRKVAEGEYFIGEDKLWKSAGQTTLRGTRAYFTAPAAKAGSNIFLVWGGEDEPTGIKGADIPVAPAVAAPVYNLYGQKMGTSIDNLPSGIYIVNGKKIKK